jgi:hypothetical protein
VVDCAHAGHRGSIVIAAGKTSAVKAKKKRTLRRLSMNGNLGVSGITALLFKPSRKINGGVWIFKPRRLRLILIQPWSA